MKIIRIKQFLLFCILLLAIGIVPCIEIMAAPIISAKRIRLDDDCSFENFSDGFCVVFNGNNEYYYIDKNGKNPFDCVYHWADSFSEGMAVIEMEDNQCGYINTKGEEVIKCKYSDALAFSDGLAAVKKSNGKWGYVNAAGEEVINFIYNDARSFSEGIAIVKKDGKYGGIDATGKLVIDCKYEWLDTFKNGMAIVVKDDKCGYINKQGEQIIKCKYDYAHSFSEEMALVEKNDKYGFVNINGEEIVKCKYDYAEDFSEGMALVEKDDKVGFIDQNGKEVIKCQFFSADSFNEGIAPVIIQDYDGRRAGYINKAGEVIAKNKKINSVSITFSEGIGVVYTFHHITGEKQTVLVDENGNDIKMDEDIYVLRNFQDGLSFGRDSNNYYYILSIDGYDKEKVKLTTKNTTIKLSKKSFIYDGKEKNPTVKVLNSEGKALKKNYYSVKYSNNVKVGKATVTIKFKDKYSGTIKAAYTIKPKATKITGASKKKNSVTLTWKKQMEQISGYQIQYATDSKFTENKKTIIVPGAKKSSETISGLSNNTKYYFRIRTYKTVNGKKFYSSWSKIYAVNTK